MITFKDGFIKIDTANTTMLIRERGDFAELFYYGVKLNDVTGGGALGIINRVNAHASVDNYDTRNTLFSFFGDGNDKEEYVRLINSDGNFTNKFVYAGHESVTAFPDIGLPTAHGAKDCVALCYEDKIHAVKLKIYIAVYGGDVLTFSSEIINCGKAEIRVQRLFSAQLDFDGTEFGLLTLDGAWARERAPHYTEIIGGTHLIDSKTGSSSGKHNPFVAVKNNRRGDYVAFNPVYSGNHKFEADVSPLGQARFLSGMNDYMLDYPVGAGESFYSPQTAVVYAESLSEITARMHGFVNDNLIPARFKGKERPVLLNNWEATYFNFDRKKLESLADKAQEIGIELFVLDDGWFGKRDDDGSGLGDWFDNEKKTGGLKGFSDYLHSKNMKFGLWVEPEMVSPDSDLYRRHPEYALAAPNCPPIERRRQLMLDLCKPAVTDYIIKVISDVLNKCKPDYVKWDCNRIITDASCTDGYGRFFYDYTKGVYKIIKTITESFPDVLFEGCSSGGNRFDLGILCYMPQIWCSDDTDARRRVSIQHGTLIAYPQGTMGSHVSASPNHQTGNRTPLKERFIIAAAGAFGYELDITRMTEEELSEIKKQIEFYKAHRRLLQFGKYECFENGNYNAYGVFDGDEAAITVVRKERHVNGIKEKIRLGGFDPDGLYRVKAYGFDDEFNVSGGVLNSGDLDLAGFFDYNDTNAVSALMLYCKKLK